MKYSGYSISTSSSASTVVPTARKILSLRESLIDASNGVSFRLEQRVLRNSAGNGVQGHENGEVGQSIEETYGRRKAVLC